MLFLEQYDNSRHHRFNILKELGMKKIPVNFINYMIFI